MSSQDDFKDQNGQSPSHEMRELAPEQPGLSAPPIAERRRVRINSSAAEIPRPASYSRISNSESRHSDTLQPVDSSSAEAQELWEAHRPSANAAEQPGSPNANSDISTESAAEVPDYGYSYSGNTQGGVFYQLLQAYKTPTTAMTGNYSSTESLAPSPKVPETASRPGSSSGRATPRKKWYKKDEATRSQETLATLIGAAAELANPQQQSRMAQRPAHKRQNSNPILSKIWKAKEDQDAKIKIHVASILKRQQYIIKMCRALMLFGAPTHRLEEYLATTAKVLEVNSQFLYIPGCMIISFDDTRKLNH